jgi:hypothetical protein
VAPLKLLLVRAVAHVSLATAVSIVAAPAFAQPTDVAVKAAFLPRFAKYVSWPPSAMPRGTDPFNLCIIGFDPFGAMLDSAARSQSVDGRSIAIRRMDSAVGADSCQIAFVDGSRAPQIIAAIGRRPVLTVTDSGASGVKGIIQFVIEGGRVRFFIDQSSAAQHGIVISSRLLALAVGVRQ